MIHFKKVLDKGTFPILFLLVILNSCSPSSNAALLKKYPTLAFNEEVTVLAIDDPRPKNVEVLGTIKIRDTGFSVKCNYERVVERAKLEARKAGGNIIQLTKHKKPDFWSTCHRIDATILRTTN